MNAVPRDHQIGAKRPIYLDYQSTTPCDPRVVAAMLPLFTEEYGNPHSLSHAYGRAARDAVETARAEVAAAIGASPDAIVFTSGATNRITSRSRAPCSRRIGAATIS